MNCSEIRKLNETNPDDIIAVNMIMSRKDLPTDEMRSEFYESRIKTKNLMNSKCYPLIGIVFAEGFVSEIMKIVTDDRITSIEFLDA